MIVKYITPLLLLKEMGTLIGKTRFQKLICLVEADGYKNKSFRTGFSFEIYLHGPYSIELTRVIDELVRQGMIKQEIQQTPAGNIQYIYTLTIQGEKFIEDVVSSNNLFSGIADSERFIVKTFGYLPLQDLIDKAYEAYNEIQ